MTLNELQNRFNKWHSHNFPYAKWDEPLMGVVEELGELHHALLKQKQKIRGTYKEHDDKAKDAVGDMIVFLVHFCNLRGYDLETIMYDVWQEIKDRDWIEYPKNGRTE